ncbi:MAG: zinc ribbon domain-containing protein [Acidobacteriota bacterium]
MESVHKSLSQPEHRCVGCGLIIHRDHNAASNLLHSPRQ